MKFFSEENGNAIAELVILIPLYITLVFGMIYLGELGLAQISIEKSARCLAWDKNQGLAKKNITYNFKDVSYQPQGRQLLRSGFSKKTIQQAMNDSGGSSNDDLISEITHFLSFNGRRDGVAVKSYFGRVSISFGISGLPISRSPTLRAQHFVTIYNTKAKREQRSTRGYRHGIEELMGAALDGGSSGSP